MNREKLEVIKSFLDDVKLELNQKLVNLEPIKQEIEARKEALAEAEKRFDEASEGIDELLSDKKNLESILGICEKPVEQEPQEDNGKTADPSEN